MNTNKDLVAIMFVTLSIIINIILCVIGIDLFIITTWFLIAASILLLCKTKSEKFNNWLNKPLKF